MDRLIRTLIFLLIFTSCKMNSYEQKLIIDIQSDTTLIIKKIEKQGDVWGLNLKIVGDFKDTVTLIHTNGDNIAYHHKLISGIDSIYQYHSDWYSDSCLIRFENIKKPIMNLRIDYEFLSL